MTALWLYALVWFYVCTEACSGVIRSHRGPLFVVTGSTGVLGTSLCLQLARGDRFEEVYMGYRDDGRLAQTLSLISSVCSEEIVSQHFHPFRCDVHSSTGVDVQELVNLLPSTAGGGVRDKGKRRIVIINNAGVCIEGSSEGALQESLDVNALHPINFAFELLDTQEMRDYDVTVLNISSGDGELAWLHSDLAELIAGLDSLAEWQSFTRKERDQWRGKEFEYAYGSSPMYSFSKSLLNAGTRALHNHIIGSPYPSRRVVLAVCPGNFASPMSTQEEQEGTASPEDVAAEVLALATSPTEFHSGRFYRHGEEIPW